MHNLFTNGQRQLRREREREREREMGISKEVSSMHEEIVGLSP